MVQNSDDADVIFIFSHAIYPRAMWATFWHNLERCRSILTRCILSISSIVRRIPNCSFLEGISWSSYKSRYFERSCSIPASGVPTSSMNADTIGITNSDRPVLPDMQHYACKYLGSSQNVPGRLTISKIGLTSSA
jgi:hypothetical protein